MKTAGLSQI